LFSVEVVKPSFEVGEEFVAFCGLGGGEDFLLAEVGGAAVVVIELAEFNGWATLASGVWLRTSFQLCHLARE
jgi:hypothetical protein